MATGVELAGVGVELIPGIAGADNLTIGTSTITGATDGRVLFDNAGVLGQYPITGTINVVMSNTPTLVAPVLGAATGTSVVVTGTLAAYSGTVIPAGGTTGSGIKVSSTANFGVFFGSGAPTLTAAKGSLYLRSDGSGVNDRAYIATDGAGTWTPLVTVG